MITIKQKVHFKRGASGRRRITTKPSPTEMAQPGRVPRISKLMALAIRFEGLVREGKVSDQSELARLAHVTQPRITQIMNLLHLAPDIQEALLYLPLVIEGRDLINERDLRLINCFDDWTKQRSLWMKLRKSVFETPATQKTVSR